MTLGKVQQKKTARKGKDEKVRQELTGGMETCRPCKPYPKQHRMRKVRVLNTQCQLDIFRGWQGFLRQRRNKIDGRLIQNPAYGWVLIFYMHRGKRNRKNFCGFVYFAQNAVGFTVNKICCGYPQLFYYKKRLINYAERYIIVKRQKI